MVLTIESLNLFGDGRVINLPCNVRPRLDNEMHGAVPKHPKSIEAARSVTEMR